MDLANGPLHVSFWLNLLLMQLFGQPVMMLVTQPASVHPWM